MESDDGYTFDHEEVRDHGEKGPGHEYPTYEHRQSDFEGKMAPRPPTENELTYLRHLAWWIRLKIGWVLPTLFVALANPGWYFIYDNIPKGKLPFAASLLLATICVFSFLDGFKFWYDLFQAGVDASRLRTDDPLTEIRGKYRSRISGQGGRTLFRIGARVQMLPHWRRYLLEYLHTSALAYVFPNPDVDLNRSALWGTRDKYYYPLLCRQIDCRENPEAVDPVLSVDKEVDWGLLKTLYLNPVHVLITAAGAYHLLGMSLFAGCIWWYGDPVWATLTEPLIGKGLMATALIGGPLAAFFYYRHRRILNRIEVNYAEEQNLEPRDLWKRIRFSYHEYDLSEENLVYGEGTTFADWAEDSKKQLYQKYTEMMADLNERIEAREEVNEEFRARGESPPVEELQRLEEMKERYNRYRRTRKQIVEQYEKMKDGKVAKALQDAKKTEEMPPWLSDFLDEKNGS